MRRKKNLKLPNGFGSITYLGERRRKPWRARKTLKWQIVDSLTGQEIKKNVTPSDLSRIVEKQVYINIGTFETYEEAFLALSKYNECPYDLNADKITLQEVTDKWSETILPTFSESTQTRFNNLIRSLPDELLDKKIKQIRVIDLESSLSEMDSAQSVLSQVKTVLKHIFDYALRYDYCDKNYAAMIELRALGGKELKKNPHKVLTDEEIIIASKADKCISYPILVALYTGMRPKELLTLQTCHVNLEERIIRHGMKTDAGRNRLIPIHPEIQGILEERCAQSETGFIFETETGPVRPLSYEGYKCRFKKLLPEHTPHDTRHTFVTQWRAVLNLDDKIGHLIVGHKSRDISESTYTHRDISSLVEEMNRFGYGTGKLSDFKAVG